MKILKAIGNQLPAFTLFISAVMVVAVSHDARGAGFDPVVRQEQPVVSDTMFSAEGFGMTVHAAPGTYGIEVSQDLSSWTALDDLVLETASAEFADAESTGLGRRFYRVAGAFESSDYHFLEVYLQVEADVEGRLFSGFRAFDTLRLSTTGSPATRLRIYDERMSDIRVSGSGEVQVNAFLESGSGSDGHIGELVLQAHEDRLDFYLPGFSEGTPFKRLETREPLEFSTHVIDADLTTLAGGGAAQYTITVDGNVTVGREVFLSLLGRKSENASIGALESEWGLIRYLVEASGWGALYNVGAYTLAMNAQTSEIDISHVREVEIEQLVNLPLVEVNLDHMDENDAFGLPITIHTDGRVNVVDEFFGFVSSSGDFMALSGVNPELFDQIGDNESIEEIAEKAMSQFLIAVPRDVSPQLAGRSYHLMGIGNWVEAEGFEVVTHPYGQNTLVFSGDGTTADLTYKADGYYVGLAGGIGEAVDPPGTFTLDVTIDPNGLIRMGLHDGGVEAAVFGFARKGGDALILGGGYDYGDMGGIDALVGIEIDE